MFIKHVLGVDSDHDGVFGPTNAYYGTVEQQGIVHSPGNPWVTRY